MELFGVILEQLVQEFDVRNSNFEPHAHHVLEVYTPQWLQSTHSDIKGYSSMQVVGTGVSYSSMLITVFISCPLSAPAALVAYMAGQLWPL
jgi:hypothetical protein